MRLPVRRHVAGIDFTICEPDDATEHTPTVVCLHGIGGDDQSFLPQSEQLSERYRIVAWNMPGYARSDALPTMTFAGLSEVLARWLDKLEFRSVHLLGQSIGGMLAQEFAHRHPERVSSLILVATTTAFGGRDDRFKDAFLAARLEPLDKGLGMSDLAARAVPEIVGPDATRAALDSAIRSMSAVSEDTYRQVLKCLVTFDRRLDWPRLRCPVCLLAGSDDENAPASTMKKMATKSPDCEFHELARAGHLVNLEQADASNVIISRFLDTRFP